MIRTFREQAWPPLFTGADDPKGAFEAWQELKDALLWSQVGAAA